MSACTHRAVAHGDAASRSVVFKHHKSRRHSTASCFHVPSTVEMNLPPSSGFSLRSGSAAPPPAGRPGVPGSNGKRPSWQPVAVVAAAAAFSGAVYFARPPDAFAAVTEKKLSGTAYWEDTWQKNQLGWHLKDVNKILKKYSGQFLGTDGGRVLVPLCGKTIDLAYLKSQKRVTEVVAAVIEAKKNGVNTIMGDRIPLATFAFQGVEYVPKAIEEFAAENSSLKLVKSEKKQGSYSVWSADKLTLFVGDIFKFTDSKKFDKVWDRGSLVALEPALRSKYAATILNALAPGGTILLSAFERVAGSPESLKAGPPFSVTEEDVKKLYGSSCAIKKLESVDVTVTNPRWKAAGLTKINEVAYLITKNGPTTAAKK